VRIWPVDFDRSCYHTDWSINVTTGIGGKRIETYICDECMARTDWEGHQWLRSIAISIAKEDPWYIREDLPL
jgi:hypothetical protein